VKATDLTRLAGLTDTSMGFGAGFIRRRSLSNSSSPKARAKRQRIFGSQSLSLASATTKRCIANALRYVSLYFTVGNGSGLVGGRQESGWHHEFV
jgi:hypothetical protein